MSKASKIPYERIERDFGNHRTVDPTSADVIELAESIGEVGVIAPPLVWHRRMSGSNPHILPNGDKVYDRYLLLAGHRRMAAMDLIRGGYTAPDGTKRPGDPGAFWKLWVSLLEGTEDDALYAQAVENMQREDLSPVQAAGVIEGFRRRGHEIAHIATKLGKSVSWVERILTFRDTVPAVLQAVAAEGMGISTALDLANAPPEAQAAAAQAFRTAVVQTSSVRKANRAARATAAALGGPRQAPSAKEVARRLKFLESLRAPSAEIKLACAVLAWVRGDGPYPSQLPGG